MTKQEKNTIKDMKELLSDPKNKIKLDDFVSEHVKDFLNATSLERFPVQGANVNKEDFLQRMQEYEKIVKDLQQIVILLARWGDQEQLFLLEKIFSRLIEADKGSAGLTLWLNFNWYPIQILMYSAGIAALSVKKYDTLNLILSAQAQGRLAEGKNLPLIVAVASNLAEINDQFKWIPGQEKKHVPRSEHLFQILNPVLEDLLFIGKGYEKLFDDFEVYSALVYASATGRGWGPLGRFGWKHSSYGGEDSPFNRIVGEAKNEKEKWLPLQAGMFAGSTDHFLEVSGAFEKQLNGLHWY